MIYLSNRQLWLDKNWNLFNSFLFPIEKRKTNKKGGFMNKKIKYLLGIVIIAMLLLSIFYINTEHEYDLTLPDEVKTDEQ